MTDTAGPPLLAPGELGLGSLLAGRYRIMGILGDGGMGSVYLAEHVTLGKLVAIKVLKPELTHDASLVERFFREARATAAIEHENIVEILDFGQTPEHAFFAMEALEGCELADIVGHGRAIGWARAKPIIVQIARGLAAAHRAGIVHRDMKPGNVFLIARAGTADFVKVLDFGIAKIDDGVKLTQAGMVFGTASYMAPEQAAGSVVDGRGDLYALGCMVFEMLTGRVPFPGDNFMKVIGQHIGEPPPRLRDVAPQLDVPAHVIDKLEALVAKALAKYPHERHADMVEFERAVIELDGTLPPSLDHGAPLPAPLAGPPRVALPGTPPADSTVMMPGMGGAAISDLDQQTLAPIAYLFVAFAHGTDGVLTNAEMRTLADRLRRWAPQVGLDGIGHVLREAVSSYGGSGSNFGSKSGSKSGELAQVRAQLVASFPPANLTQLLVDLREIASADGQVSDAEQRFIAETARAFGLEGDNRLSSLAFMYLALGSVTEGTVAPTEMKVLGEQLRQWAPGASINETAAALREAVAEYKRLPGVEARLARAHAAAETLRRSTDAETLRRVLADLWRIAGADGHISPEEQRFIMGMVERFGAN
ncbi:protein kinase domain-containing protein [Enhygromyxa salina]|uniref:protein kinase domain-containing protein n=1 Tax=Enhygromyxa salina TaxID=215803 RepID=UPI0011B25E66|nr:protein kinase [Enhygromyxa salina]